VPAIGGRIPGKGTGLNIKGETCRRYLTSACPTKSARERGGDEDEKEGIYLVRSTKKGKTSPGDRS